MYEIIKELCDKNNITGKKLGEMLGLKKSPLTDWKNGKAKPTIDQVKSMCEIFAVSADYILEIDFTNKNETDNEKELLEYFNILPQREQIKIIGIVEEKAKAYKTQSELSYTSETG